MENKKTLVWIIGGVVVGAVIVYFAVSGGLSIPGVQGPVSGVQTPEGTVMAPGASPISDAGQVVTPSGKPVQQDVMPGSPDAPQQSGSIAETSVPASAVKLEISSAGFSPSEFTVDAGDPVVLSLTSTDGKTHVFYFNDPELQAVALGVGPNETRLIPFNAPAKAGEYAFHCDVPGHAARGEVGKMVVK
ncbi:MAG: cupredoxin domain-containing protein [Candidatus Jorgensenbacteria bacterium]